MALDRDLRRLAQESATSAIAQVTGSGDNGYSLALTDGTTIASVGNGDGLPEWADDTWVTIERAGSAWQIAGLSPYKAG